MWIQAQVSGYGSRKLWLWGRVENSRKLPRCLCSPSYTEWSCPHSTPWVLTVFSVPPKNRVPVECGSGGSRGATGGGRRGGSSLLLRSGLGLATNCGSLDPRCRGRVGPPEQEAASNWAEIPLPESPTSIHRHLKMRTRTQTDAAQTCVSFPTHSLSNPFL